MQTVLQRIDFPRSHPTTYSALSNHLLCVKLNNKKVCLHPIWRKMKGDLLSVLIWPFARDRFFFCSTPSTHVTGSCHVSVYKACWIKCLFFFHTITKNGFDISMMAPAGKDKHDSPSPLDNEQVLESEASTDPEKGSDHKSIEKRLIR